jgi:hypothetical protein
MLSEISLWDFGFYVSSGLLVLGLLWSVGRFATWFYYSRQLDKEILMNGEVRLTHTGLEK